MTEDYSDDMDGETDEILIHVIRANCFALRLSVALLGSGSLYFTKGLPRIPGGFNDSRASHHPESSLDKVAFVGKSTQKCPVAEAEATTTP